MPRMDGYECVRRIHKLLKLNGITDPESIPKIYAVTGHVEPEYKKMSIESGILNVYSKPIDISQLQLLLLQSGFEIELKGDVEQFLGSHLARSSLSID
mmetsp:Transcript_16155/g.27333  ORF Transcript_16155/g.27333 Transcript_16155/m.27333 type:complete len:98 (+) Transcript_16155:200-493(+)